MHSTNCAGPRSSSTPQGPTAPSPPRRVPAAAGLNAAYAHARARASPREPARPRVLSALKALPFGAAPGCCDMGLRLPQES